MIRNTGKLISYHISECAIIFLPYKDILTLRAKNSIYEHTKFKIYSELEVKHFWNVKGLYCYQNRNKIVI